MSSHKILSLALMSVILGACSSGSNSPSVGTTPPGNTGGGVITGVITARFDSAVGAVPFPTNLLLNGSTDVTLNPPVVNATNFGDPAVALSALDGFSTSAPWSTTFSVPVDPATVVAGQTVRMYEVTRQATGIGITGFVRELAPGTEYVTAVVPSTESDPRFVTGARIAVIPTRALEQLKTYMVVVTKGVRDLRGNDATPDSSYFLAKRLAPVSAGVGAACVSLDPLLPNANACALEPVRQLVNSQEAVAVARGVARDDIVISWSATTLSVTPVLSAVRATQTAQASTIVRTPLNIGQLGLGLPPIADVYIGITPVNYYLIAPGAVPEGSAAGAAASSPTAVLTGFWRARPNGYVAPFSAFGLDPTSTNLTFANPVPVRNSVQNVPVLMTIPNAAAGPAGVKPAAGYPVVIFNHGITRNRSDMLAVSATYAQAGWAVIAIDQPLHGLDRTSPFYIESTPFAAVSSERTFDVDLINNLTSAPGPDGSVDPSGAHFINLTSLLSSRDNNRQSQADLLQLVKNLSVMDVDGVAGPDFDVTRIAYTGQSLGSINLIPAMALETTVNVGVLNVPGGGIARLLNGSPTFGPRIRGGLQAGAGLVQGTTNFDTYFTITQTAIDAADPLNFARALVVTDRVLLQEVVGSVPASDPSCALANAQGAPIAGAPADGCPDAVIPNTVAGAPLAGTEALIATMGLTPIIATVQSATGIRGVTRFTRGDHGSLLSPAKNAAVTGEMQGQMASMVASGGTSVRVTNTTVLKTN